MKHSKTKLALWQLTPFLFTGSLILNLYLNNINELVFFDLITPLTSSLLFALILSIIFTFTFKSRVRGIVFGAVCMVMFFTYGTVTAPLGDFAVQLGNFRLPISLIILPIEALVIWKVFLYVKRTDRKLENVAKYFFVTAVIITSISVARIVNYEVTERVHTKVQSPLTLPAFNKAVLQTKEMPDIYYIMPEDYSSPRALRQYFNYSDRAFVDFLRNRDFYVASQSASNYPKTFLSVASSLNMEYLDYLSKYNDSSDQTIPNLLIENNNVLKSLKKLGYKYYQMGSWWDPTRFNHFADANYTLQKQADLTVGGFTYTVAESSMLKPFLEVLISKKIVGESDDDKRAMAIFQFETIAKIVKKPGPKFTFVHIMSPHEPYVFGKNCQSINPATLNPSDEEKNYTNQINCINEKIESAIDQILNGSSKPPVIILQSDEGAPFLNEKLDPPDSWKNADTKLLKEKFPILAALYLPGVPKETLYPSITPVNFFRVVFNNYFGTNMQILPDRNYIFPDLENLYNFREVTDRLK